jgi:two-component sensor histidine kinase
MGHLDTRRVRQSAPEGEALVGVPTHDIEAGPVEAFQSQRVTSRAEVAPDRLTAVARLIFNAPTMMVWFEHQEHGSGASDLHVSSSHDSADCIDCRSGPEVPSPDAISSVSVAGRPPVVDDERLLFHTAAPLYTPEWRLLGVLHVASQEARPESMAAEDERRLEVLAGIAAEVIDIRQRLRIAEEALAEKDLLAREADHRVANGLQLIQGALSLQAAAESGTAQGPALRAAAGRVAAIAGAHRHLHSTAAATPDGIEYIRALLRKLALPPDMAGGTEEAEGRPVVLDAASGVAKAIPAGLLPRLGLIVAELVANALKHGSGRVLVQLSPAPAFEGGGVVLAVSDQGSGFPLGFEPAAPGRTGLGMRLISSLSRPGHVEIDPDDRRRIIVRLVDRASSAASQRVSD